MKKVCLTIMVAYLLVGCINKVPVKTPTEVPTNVGKVVSFEGVVAKVYEDGRVLIDTDTTSTTNPVVVLYGIKGFTQDQRIAGTGKIIDSRVTSNGRDYLAIQVISLQ